MSTIMQHNSLTLLYYGERKREREKEREIFYETIMRFFFFFPSLLIDSIGFETYEVQYWFPN